MLDAAGGRVAESRHYPYGAVRWTWPEDESTFPTDYRFTGQRDVGLGLTHMGARFLDTVLGRWTSADTIVADLGNPQSLNRYSYVNNRPLRLVDSGGHYGRDVHLDLTAKTASRVESRIVAMVGLTVYPGDEGKLRGSVIAAADQRTDEDPNTVPIDVIRGVEGTDGRVAEYYHFVSLAEAEQRLQAAVESKDAAAFGQAMHAYQDYWSHTRKGYTVPMFGGGMDQLLKSCPECSSLYSWETLADRAGQLGHFPDKWNDLYAPEMDADDVFMQQGLEYWLVLFLCEFYGIDPAEYWAIYGEIKQPDEYAHEN